MTEPLHVLVWGHANDGPCAFPAWAAGFLDGEGCIQISRAGRGMRAHVLRVSVPQVARAPLDALAARFGGGISHKQGARPGHRAQYVWEITSYPAARMLEEVIPYLLVKRGEAELAVLYQLSKTTRQGRRKTELEMAEAESFRRALIEAHHFTEGGDAQ